MWCRGPLSHYSNAGQLITLVSTWKTSLKSYTKSITKFCSWRCRLFGGYTEHIGGLEAILKTLVDKRQYLRHRWFIGFTEIIRVLEAVLKASVVWMLYLWHWWFRGDSKDIDGLETIIKTKFPWLLDFQI